MFDVIRNHQRLMYALLLLIIFPPFIMFGLDGFTKMKNGNQNVAEINGVAISQQEFLAIKRNWLEKLRAQYGNSVDAKVLDTPESRQSLLDQVIRERLQAEYQRNKHLGVSDAKIIAWLTERPEFRGQDNKFDRARYQQFVQSRGKTEAAFEDAIRNDLSYEILPTSVVSSTIVPTTVTTHLFKLFEEKRSVRELVMDRKEYQAQVKLDAETISNFYKTHSSNFKVPEQADIEYLVLNEAALLNMVTISEAALQAYYDANKNNYTSAEERRASHILIKAEKGLSPDERKKLREKAQSILETLRKQPEKFSEIAKKISDDVGSKNNAGDLGFFGRGMMVKPFENAVFNLKLNEISDLVESEFGWHIIKLTAIKASTTRPLNEVRDQVQEIVRKQEAMRKFSELSDQFSELTFKNPENINAVAQALKLPIQKVQGLSRHVLPNTQLAIYQAKFLDTIFSEDSIKNKKLTDVIDVGNNTLITGRIVSYRPASTRPLAEVENNIRQTLSAEQAEKIAVSEGEVLLKKIQSNPTNLSLLKNFGPFKKIARNDSDPSTNMSADARRQIFNIPVSQLPTYIGVNLPNKGYAIYQIESSMIPNKELDSAQINRQMMLEKNLKNIYAEQTMLNIYGRLREQAKISVTSNLAKADQAEY